MFRTLAELFSKTALEVCEGQQYDVDFETRDDVSLDEYIHMINCKTAVLLGAAMKMGAIVAEASESCRSHLYEFGRNLGIAFQLKDDYLDAFGNLDTFGKQIGGDIISNKKTFLFITAQTLCSPSEAETLEHLYSISPKDTSDKIETVKAIFVASGAAAAAQKEIELYTQKAYTCLNQVQVSSEKKETLRQFGDWLMRRTV
jgi:geranylgeranyl diphosphate synthase type II